MVRNMQKVTIQAGKVPSRKFSAVQRRARSLGLSPEKYIQRLIDEDLALDRKARTLPWEQIARPFHEALKDLKEEDIDGLVERARRKARVRSSR